MKIMSFTVQHWSTQLFEVYSSIMSVSGTVTFTRAVSMSASSGLGEELADGG